MRLIAQTRYSIRVLLDLAMHRNGGLVQVNEIANRQNISLKYLEQIIPPLKKAGFVNSKRGRCGGHALALPPEIISLGEIVRTLEPEGADGNDADGKGYPEYQDAMIREAWKDAKEAFYTSLGKITLADLSSDTSRKFWDQGDFLFLCD